MGNPETTSQSKTMRAVVAPRPKAYSYVRFSTPEQSKGDSFRRQSDAALAYAQKYDLDLVLDVTFHDLGVSAFTGKNAETGALRAFLNAANKGHIESGSFLLVESLDRISRASIVQAQTLFMQIITSGITLVTLGDGRQYSEESMNANPTDFLISLLVLMRGNDESATKARRVKAAWANKRTQAAEHGRLLTKLVPGWVRLTSEGVLEAIPERADIIRRIFALFLDGMGKEGIAKLLNSEQVQPWGMATRKPGRHWHASYVTKILDNPAVLGILTTRTVETDKGQAVAKEAMQIAGYYPKVVDEETFARVRALRDTAGVTRHKGRSLTKNLLAGLAVCPCCKGSMIRVNKGGVRKAGYPYLVCSKAKVGAGCKYRAVRLGQVEAVIRLAYPQLSEALLFEGNDGLSKEIDELETFTSVLADELENIAETLSKAGHSPLLVRKMRELEAEMEKAALELREKRSLLFTRTHAMRRARIEDLRPLLESSDIAKANLALREVLRSVVINYETRELECITKSNSSVTLTYAWPNESSFHKGSFVVSEADNLAHQ